MSKEALVIVGGFEHQITEAVKAKDAGKLFSILRELNKALCDQDTYAQNQEAEFLQEQIGDFLADEHRVSMLLPIGGDPFEQLLIYRGDGEISFRLAQETSDETRKRWDGLKI